MYFETQAMQASGVCSQALDSGAVGNAPAGFDSAQTAHSRRAAMMIER
jgi:hypothetical protein